MAYLSQDLKDWTEAERIYLILMDLRYKNMTWSGMLAKDSVRYPFPDKKTLDMYVLTGEAFEPQRSESTEHDLYIQLLWVYSESGQMSKYDALITVSRAKYPENENLLKMELQSYLEKEDYAGALKNLKEAIVKNPSSALYLYNAGYIYHQQMKDPENGKAYYELAVAADPKYLDAVYMLGLMEIDASNVWVQKINKLGRSENTKAKSYAKEKVSALGRALVYFEKAYAIDSKDEATLKALREVYYKLTRYDDVKRITSEMKQI
jgi:tetratricopeptide (TPR) repeat protein